MDRHRKGKEEETEEKQVFEAYRLLWTKKRAVNRGQDDKVKGQELSRPPTTAGHRRSQPRAETKKSPF